MRFILLILTGGGLLASCGTSSNSDDTTTATDSSSITYLYSNSFEMADPSLVDIVKGWNNSLEKRDIDMAVSYLADSIEAVFADGTYIHTTRDSMRRFAEQFMAGLSSIRVDYIAQFAVRSTDRNEDWVVSYTDEGFSSSEGDTRHLAHELYKIVNGKIRTIYAYAETPSSIDEVPTAGTDEYLYSGSFEMLSNDYLDIANGWYEALLSKNFDDAANYIADSVMVIFDNGSFMHVTRDSLVSFAREFMKTNQMSIDRQGGLAVRSKDQNEDWVLMWFEETMTNAEGTEKASSHEALQVKDNKIVLARIFKAAVPPQE